ncbi:hypothetical protein D3C81_154590 [compost metagenome]
MSNSYVYLSDIFNQRLRFPAANLLAEVTGEAFFQVFGFTDVDNRASSVIHTVDARLAGYGAEKCFGIKTVTHCLTTSPH